MIRYLTTYLVPDFSLREEWAEWPDLAIFESFCQQLSLQKYPKVLLTCWDTLKTSILK